MRDAFEKLLGILPECRAEVGGLCIGSEYFGLQAADVYRAAEALPLHYDLSYQGIRLLLSACLEEFAAIFRREDGVMACETSVPAPVCAMYALQEAGREIRFVSSAFFAQIVLRSILLYRGAIGRNTCAVRRCGLNKMRQLLLERPPVRPPEYQLQFGVLCDECVKVGEAVGAGSTKTISMTCPPWRNSGIGELRQSSAMFLDRVCQQMDIRVSPGHIRRACALYGRLMKAHNRITQLNEREDRLPLRGNSLALAHSVQIMTTPRAEQMITALEILADELEQYAPKDTLGKRFYCFFIPFLQPEIDRRFRENGVSLLGNAAFLFHGKAFGIALPDMIAAWVHSMNIRLSREEECIRIAEAMGRCGCNTYLTGAFGFDRWMGANLPLERQILEERYGIRLQTLETDFWCENAPYWDVAERIDAICGVEA